MALLLFAALALPTHTPAAAIAHHAARVWDGLQVERAHQRLVHVWRVHTRREKQRRREATRVAHQDDAAATPTYESPPSNYVGSNAQAICQTFGDYCDEAIRVAACESGGGDPLAISTTAANGQYLGAFQLGSAERAAYGHGSSIWTQAWAAYRYFIDSGSDWSPWACAWAAS